MLTGEGILITSDPELVYNIKFRSNCDQSFIEIKNYYYEPLDIEISSKTSFFAKDDLDKYGIKEGFDIATAGVEKFELKYIENVKNELEKNGESVTYIGAVASCLHSNNVGQSALVYEFIKSNKQVYISPYTGKEIKIHEIAPLPEEPPPPLLSESEIDKIANILLLSDDDADINNAIVDLLISKDNSYREDDINYFVENSYERNPDSDFIRSAVCKYLEYKKISRYYCENW
jgi:hypothetical protein